MGHSYTESKNSNQNDIDFGRHYHRRGDFFALTGKGYIINGFHMPHWLVGGVMIVMSVVKAYLIIYEFMHMKYEVPALVKTVLIPTLLLVWAIIAFTYEGSYWQNARSKTHNLKSTATTEQVEHH